MPMNFREFSATRNILQDLDSFPEDSDSQRKLHRIVKKQMAITDYKQVMKKKRSVLNRLHDTDNGADNSADKGEGRVIFGPQKGKDNGKRKGLVIGSQKRPTTCARKGLIIGSQKGRTSGAPDATGNSPKSGASTGLNKGVSHGLKKGLDHGLETGAATGLNKEVGDGLDTGAATGLNKEVGDGLDTGAPTDLNKKVGDGLDTGAPTGLNKKVGDGLDTGAATGLNKKVGDGLDTGAATGLNKEVGDGLDAGAATGLNKKVGDGLDTGAATGLNKEVGDGLDTGAPTDLNKKIDSVLNNGDKIGADTHTGVDSKSTGRVFEPCTEETKSEGEKGDIIRKRLKGFVICCQKFFPDKELLFGKKLNLGKFKEAKETASSEADKIENEMVGTENKFHKKDNFKLPDDHNIHCYYECESLPYGCMKLKHKQCPQGQFFSLKYMRCLKMCYWKELRRKKSAAAPYISKKLDLPEPTPDDVEPANEWLDATQSGETQKIPAEFKPKKKPTLKVYHLRVKRKLHDMIFRKKGIGKRHILNNLGSASSKSQRKLACTPKGAMKHEGARRHHPRSFVIRINKKEGKHSREGVTETDDSDTDDDNDEGDEEDDEEDAEEDEEESEEDDNTEEDVNKTTEKINRKDSIKEFFRSAKAAITNRAKFTDPSIPIAISSSKENSSLKNKKSDDISQKSKQVLLDANIKVDSTFSNALKNILKSKQKEKHENLILDNEGLISDRGSQDQMDPELLRVYQHLIRNNPRVKRYFLVNCAERKN